MADTVDEEGHRAKRFKHQSYKEQLRDVHLPSALAQSKTENEVDEGSSLFHESLMRWSQLNLSPAFLAFTKKVLPASQSLALLVLHWKDVLTEWFSCAKGADDEALKALFDLLQSLVEDLRLTVASSYEAIIEDLFNFLPKKISPESLTALLSVLSTLFKHLLSSKALEEQGENDRLSLTWSMSYEKVQKCNKEVQRAFAEVWASTLRRLKVVDRKRLVELMLAQCTSEDGMDFCAWVFSFACKSVSQTLHTCTPTIVLTSVDWFLSDRCNAPEETKRILTRVLTALIHHCNKPDQFAVVSESLIDRLSQVLSEQGSTQWNGRAFHILSVMTSVRQGSRLTSKDISKVLELTLKCPFSISQRIILSKVIVSSLVASSSDITTWMGIGRRTIEHSWSTSHLLAVSITGALLESDWGGFQQFALSSFLKKSNELLNSGDAELQLRTVRVLHQFHKKRLLKDVPKSWKDELAAWVCGVLKNFQLSETNSLLFQELSALFKFIPASSFGPQLSALVWDLCRSHSDAKQDYQESCFNETWLMSKCVFALSSVPPFEEGQASSFVEAVIRKWFWSEQVMSGLSEVMKIWGQQKPLTSEAELFPLVAENLKSHSQTLRLSALQLLSSSLFRVASSREALDKCLTTERIELSVQGVRERVLRISRIPLEVVDGDERTAELCAFWLLGQLKVNLRPVWGPAGEAISKLSERFPEIIWNAVFHEIVSLSEGQTSSTPAWSRESNVSEKQDAKEDERMWRDPSAHKVSTTVSLWTSDESCRSKLMESQLSRDRFDPVSYEAQILNAMSLFSTLTEQHNRELVPHFLSFASPSLTTKPSRTKLTNWLGLFSKFNNPKAMHSSATMRVLYLSLLAHPDRSLQSLALTCLLGFKSNALNSKEDSLRCFLDDTKWRDELANLSISEINGSDREEIIEVLIRIFFGLMLEKRGRGRGADRRSALLGSLSACTGKELQLLVDLMLESLADQVVANEIGWEVSATWFCSSQKQITGFLRLLEDVLKNLGSIVTSDWPRLIKAVIALGSSAQKFLESQSTDDTDENDDENEEQEKLSSSIPASSRTIRRLCLKRLAQFFLVPADFNFSPYISGAFSGMISPRLELLDRENTQSPSALLELLEIWSRHEATVPFLLQDHCTLPKIYDCIIASNVKPAVLLKVYDIVGNILAHADHSEHVKIKILIPSVPRLLENVAVFVERSISDAALSLVNQKTISLLSDLSPYITDGTQSATLISLFLPQLKKSGKVVQERAKIDMLRIISRLAQHMQKFANDHEKLYKRTFETLSTLFLYLRGRQSRLALVAAFKEVCDLQPDLRRVGEISESLNSYSVKRMEEMDFDRRLSAFKLVNDESRSFTGTTWIPILYNLLYFIQETEELSIRTNASAATKHFISVLSHSSPEIVALFNRIVYSGLRRILLSKFDLVRAEAMSVIAHAVASDLQVESVQEMRCLLAGGDEEANFFNNIYHIQIHRRTRALRRLAEFCENPGFRVGTLREVFLPVVNSFITSSKTTDHHLVNEAINTIGQIAGHLTWPGYHSLVQQYMKLSVEDSASERTYTRALVSVLDHFHFNLEEAYLEETDLAEELEPVQKGVADSKVKIFDAVTTRLLPALMKHLDKRDGLEDSNRISIAVGITKIALHLPSPSQNLQISRLLTVVSQILRSKSQETRDVVRETLCRIAVILGPSRLPEIIRNLREALLRGPHLHVLAHVAHALLVHVTAPEHKAKFEDIDDCVPDLVHVSSEVIFGESGKDVESEGFKTKMKEVRGSSSRGMDSFAILAKHIKPSAVSGLLYPLKLIMYETESLKTMQSVEEVLGRIAVGINQNAYFGPTELLTMCHSVITQNARFFQHTVKQHSAKARRGKREVVYDVVVQTKRNLPVENDHYAHNSWRFVSFGLELFSTACRRGRFDFHDDKTLMRLEPMVNAIGNTLYSSNGGVVTSALKATAQIVKCPLKTLDKSLPVLIKQAMAIVKQAGSAEAELCQTAFKTLAVIIRDCPASRMKENDLIVLIELLTPELEEPSRQATAFALLRAIISRKFVVPEIYDIMDRVEAIMVTNQSSQVQELCRSALLQFLLDYPQGKGRLRQHMTFLAKNLSYTFESGRISVLEFLNAVVAKFHDNIISEYSDLLFAALVMAMANDDSAKCREIAAQLLRALIKRLQDSQRRSIMSLVHTWATQGENTTLQRVSSQAYGLVLEALGVDAEPYLPDILEDINKITRESASQFHELRNNDGDDEDDLNSGILDWQTPYQALSTTAKVVSTFPHICEEYNKISWSSVFELLLFPHAWVRTASCRLVGILFTSFIVSASDDFLADKYPLSRNDMKSIADSLTLQLKSENLDEKLSLQIVKNLLFVGKCFDMIQGTVEGEGEEQKGESDSEEDDEESEEDDVEEEPTLGRKLDIGYLPWLFSRLSFQARSAHIARRNNRTKTGAWSIQISSVFRWFAAMVAHLDAARLERYLVHILSPVYRVTQDDTIRDPLMEELKTLGLELQDMVQNKVGAVKFADVFNSIRQKVNRVRAERKTARVLQLSTNPQLASKRRIHKNNLKKDGRKRKAKNFADNKTRNNPLKRRKMD